MSKKLTKTTDTTKTDSNTSEAKATEGASKSYTPVISIDEYIAKANIHYMRVASFKHEASKTEKGLTERTEDEWKADFEAHGKKVKPSFPKN